MKPNIVKIKTLAIILMISSSYLVTDITAIESSRATRKLRTLTRTQQSTNKLSEIISKIWNDKTFRENVFYGIIEEIFGISPTGIETCLASFEQISSSQNEPEININQETLDFICEFF